MKLDSTELHSMKSHSTEFHSMKLHSNIKIDTIFMNSESSKTFEPHILILNLTDKLHLRRG